MKRLSDIRLAQGRQPDRDWRRKGLSANELDILLPTPPTAESPDQKVKKRRTASLKNKK